MSDIAKEHLRNQVWAMLDGLLPDILRIADAMKPTSRDDAIVLKTLCGVAGILIHRRDEAASI